MGQPEISIAVAILIYTAISHGVMQMANRMKVRGIRFEFDDVSLSPNVITEHPTSKSINLFTIFKSYSVVQCIHFVTKFAA